MNERIKELAEQCHHRYSEHRIDLEKFAELIVRECSMFVVTELEGQVGSKIADTTANKLEKHFGVEE